MKIAKITNTYLFGAFLCLIATLSWGAMFPIMSHALLKIDPFSFTAMRYTLAGIIFLLFLYFKEGPNSFRFDGSVLLLWIFGSSGFAGFGFFVFLGQKLAGPEGALSASMMMATMPLLSLLVIWVLKNKKPALFSFFFIGLSLLGVLLVITNGDIFLIFSSPGNYLANSLMLAGALCWVMYTVGASYFPSWSPIKYTALSTLLALPTIYLCTLLLSSQGYIVLPTVNLVAEIIPELLYMSLVAGFLGVLCWNQGNKIITPLNGVLFMDVVPITAFIISTFEGIVPTNAQMTGVVLTAVALVLNNLYQRRQLMITAAPILARD